MTCGHFHLRHDILDAILFFDAPAILGLSSYMV